MIRTLDVDAVIVPSVAHMGGTIPGPLVQVCDVITVSPENTYARRPLLFPGRRVDGA
ncbi:hypothetical protein ACQP1G_06160 [Nocardia sp. CA-107356]|uniref:hypothetical protein n=1 Tax=Nocardia sp. CA-107356 TaxID=3239972 RepID=UPI003D8BB1BE